MKRVAFTANLFRQQQTAGFHGLNRKTTRTLQTRPDLARQSHAIKPLASPSIDELQAFYSTGNS
ncbi:MAG: hypothetical protein ACPHYE_02030, partial [Henriciella sp.]